MESSIRAGPSTPLQKYDRLGMLNVFYVVFLFSVGKFIRKFVLARSSNNVWWIDISQVIGTDILCVTNPSRKVFPEIIERVERFVDLPKENQWGKVFLSGLRPLVSPRTAT